MGTYPNCVTILLQAYYALFHSHISYCSQVWGQPSPQTNRICKLQNKAAHLMTFSQYKSSASPLYSELKLLRFADLIQIQNISLVQKIRTNPSIVPPALMNLYNFDFSHSRSTRGLSVGLINPITLLSSMALTPLGCIVSTPGTPSCLIL